MTQNELPDDDTEPIETVVDELPAPRSALRHVNQYASAQEAPRQTVTISGVPHPAHRSA